MHSRESGRTNQSSVRDWARKEDYRTNPAAAAAAQPFYDDAEKEMAFLFPFPSTHAAGFGGEAG